MLGYGRFLTAEWRHLVMLNYTIDPAVLRPLVPAGTELDAWKNEAIVSIVGFLFLDTRILGLRVPLHGSFEEVNLRFYVRRAGEDGWRTGVVFVKELVPRPAVAWMARWLFHENYETASMSHSIDPRDGVGGRRVTYSWKRRGEHHISMLVEGGSQPVVPGSREEFLSERHWGYTRQRDGGTLEYRVEHPEWRIWRATESRLECDVRATYGPEFVCPLSGEPSSAFLADGSAVSVSRGRRIR
jgi:uncharacterized protein YqjF (DUF2071 family)